MNRKIKAMLIEHGIKQIDIARELQVDRSAVSGVVNGYWESRRIKQAIADKLHMPYKKLWGKAA